MKGDTENMGGKKVFYPKAEEALKGSGFEYFDGDKDIKGKSVAHRSRPDYVAIKGDDCVIGEIKSPDEPPTSGSWRQVQPNDSRDFAKVREDVKRREQSGKLNPEIGGHDIIIRGQIPDYVSKIGKTYDLPGSASGRRRAQRSAMAEGGARTISPARSARGLPLSPTVAAWTVPMLMPRRS